MHLAIIERMVHLGDCPQPLIAMFRVFPLDQSIRYFYFKLMIN